MFSQTPQLTTAATVKQPFTMQIALNWKGRSTGRLTIDDGLAIGNIQAGQYNAFSVTADLALNASTSHINGVIRYTAQQLAPQFDVSDLFVQRIVVLGADLKDESALPTPLLTMAGKAVPLNGMKLRVENGAIVIDSTASTLPINRSWQIRWIEPRTETEQHTAVTTRHANRSRTTSE